MRRFGVWPSQKPRPEVKVGSVKDTEKKKHGNHVRAAETTDFDVDDFLRTSGGGREAETKQKDVMLAELKQTAEATTSPPVPLGYGEVH